MVQKGMPDEMEAAQVNMSLAEQEALAYVPPFYELPNEVREKIERQVLRAERMFWLQAGNIAKDIVNTTLLRRAVYAEQRCWEMENMLGEMAIITEGAGQTVKDLAAGINTGIKELDGDG